MRWSVTAARQNQKCRNGNFTWLISLTHGGHTLFTIFQLHFYFFLLVLIAHFHTILLLSIAIWSMKGFTYNYLLKKMDGTTNRASVPMASSLIASWVSGMGLPLTLWSSYWASPFSPDTKLDIFWDNSPPLNSASAGSEVCWSIAWCIAQLHRLCSQGKRGENGKVLKTLTTVHQNPVSYEAI